MDIKKIPQLNRQTDILPVPGSPFNSCLSFNINPIHWQILLLPPLKQTPILSILPHLHCHCMSAGSQHVSMEVLFHYHD